MKKISLATVVAIYISSFMSLLAATADYRVVATSIVDSNEPATKVIHTTQAGQLETLLGEDNYKVVSLTICGPVNEDDLKVLHFNSVVGELQYLYLADALIENNMLPDYAFGYFYHDYHPPVPATETHKESWSKLVKVVLPDNLESIGHSAFFENRYLKYINMPNSLNLISHNCFRYCTDLSVDDLVIPGGVEYVYIQAFSDCKALTGRLIVSEGVKKIGIRAFAECNFSQIILPETLTTIEDAVFYGTTTKELIIPESCLEIGKLVCKNMTELEHVVLPSNLEMIPLEMFYNCANLRDITIPENVTAIEGHVFRRSGLESVYIPAKVKTIGSNAFSDCHELKVVSLPAALESIVYRTFCNCPSLQKIYCAAAEPPACHAETFACEDYPDTPRDVTVYVPIGSADKYRTATGWNYFTNFVETADFPQSGNMDIVYDAATADPQPIYDLQGRRVDNPVNGVLYIRGGHKIIYHDNK